MLLAATIAGLLATLGASPAWQLTPPVVQPVAVNSRPGGHVLTAEPSLRGVSSTLLDRTGLIESVNPGGHRGNGSVSPGRLSGYWDAAGRLVGSAVIPAGGATAPTPSAYGYDGEGNKIFRSGVSGSSTLFYSGIDVVEETGSTTTVYERKGGVIAAAGGQMLLHDKLGSVTGRWNSAGNIEGAVAFDAWGGYRTGAAPTTGPMMGYAGQLADADSDLSDDHARWYSHQLGRFLSTDPLGVTAGRMRGTNGLALYGYANGNPVGNVDPDGRASALEVLAAGLTAAAAFMGADIAYQRNVQHRSWADVSTWDVAEAGIGGALTAAELAATVATRDPHMAVGWAGGAAFTMGAQTWGEGKKLSPENVSPGNVLFWAGISGLIPSAAKWGLGSVKYAQATRLAIGGAGAVGVEHGAFTAAAGYQTGNTRQMVWGAVEVLAGSLGAKYAASGKIKSDITERDAEPFDVYTRAVSEESYSKLLEFNERAVNEVRTQANSSSRMFPNLEDPVTPFAPSYKPLEPTFGTDGVWRIGEEPLDGDYIFAMQKSRLLLGVPEPIVDPMGVERLSGHIDLARGAPVDYAGEVTFTKGRVAAWTNRSGHYLPDADYAFQASPYDGFVPSTFTPEPGAPR